MNTQLILAKNDFLFLTRLNLAQSFSKREYTID